MKIIKNKNTILRYLFIFVTSALWGGGCVILSMISSQIAKYLPIYSRGMYENIYEITANSIVFLILMTGLLAVISILEKIWNNYKIKIDKSFYIWRFSASFVFVTIGFLAVYILINEFSNEIILIKSYQFILLVSIFSYTGFLLPRISLWSKES